MKWIGLRKSDFRNFDRCFESMFLIRGWYNKIIDNSNSVVVVSTVVPGAVQTVSKYLA
jgi:hypothetical protein